MSASPAVVRASGLSQPQRLDRFLRDQFPAWGRQGVQKAIGTGEVSVNGKGVWLASWQVRNGDTVAVRTPPAALPQGPEVFDPVWLVADDGDLLALNKPAGLLAEPTRWGTGVNLLALARAYFGEELILFHRLDRDTSGVLLLTRPGPVNRWLDAQFKEHTVRKEYVAIVALPNRLGQEGTIDARLAPDPQRRDRVVVVEKGGQWARTGYVLEKNTATRARYRLFPQSGRTHQLRVHLAHRGAPILGDRLYGDANAALRLLLQAHRLTLPERAGHGAVTYEVPLSEDFLS